MRYTYKNDGFQPLVYQVGLLCFLFLFQSCQKDKCQERVYIETDSFQITFKTQNDQYLYSKQNPVAGYDIDSLYMYTSDGRDFYQKKAETIAPSGNEVYHYTYVFGNLYQPATDADALVKEKCEEYYIYYNAADTDTLTLCYQVSEGGCGLLYNPVKAYYRGQLIAQDRGIFLPITIIK